LVLALGVAVDGRAHDFPPTAYDYAKLVEPQLGVPPKVDLSEGIEVPMYADGIQVHGIQPRCDNPSRLGKGCVSGSVLQRYEGATASGDPLPDVVWVAFGRNSSYVKDGNLTVMGSVQMIGHNQVTGATAFFESNDAIAPWVTVDANHRMHGKMPWIDDADEFSRAFKTPRDVQCVECHQNDPFIHSDYIDAALIPGTDDTVVPRIRTRDRDMEFDLPYFAIGGPTWDMRTIHIEGNGCLNCHRVGMSTATLFMQNGWHPNDHMPPKKPGSLAADFEALQACWRDGPEKTEGCEWVVPPAGDQLGRIVGDEYPFKAAFNEPGKRASSVSGAAQGGNKIDRVPDELIRAMKAKGMSDEEIEEFLGANNESLKTKG
jgi:hypothetical protein